jgi:hypothetical protein
MTGWNFLDEALDSIAAQTRKADEVLVIGNVMSPVARNVTYIASEESFATRLSETIENSK